MRRKKKQRTNNDDDGGNGIEGGNGSRNCDTVSSISLMDLSYPIFDTISQFVDVHSIFSLSWTCYGWRNHFLNMDDTTFWRPLLVDQLLLNDNNNKESLVDSDTCGRLCELSGMDCRSLVMSVIFNARMMSTNQGNCRPLLGLVSYNKMAKTEDPRTLGLITFRPERLQLLLHNLTNEERQHRVQQACVDVIRWGIALATISLCSSNDHKYGQFIWMGRNGRATLLISVPAIDWNEKKSEDDTIVDESQHDGDGDGESASNGSSDSENTDDDEIFCPYIEGFSLWTYQDRDMVVEDIYGLFNGGCCSSVQLDDDAPSYLSSWMNGNCHQNNDNESIQKFAGMQNRVTRLEIDEIVKANSGITVGMWSFRTGVGGIDYHFNTKLLPGARLLNPLARYCLQCTYKQAENNLFKILNQLFLVAELPPTALGCRCLMKGSYPNCNSWPGWPLFGGLPTRFQLPKPPPITVA